MSLYEKLMKGIVTYEDYFKKVSDFTFMVVRGYASYYNYNEEEFLSMLENDYLFFNLSEREEIIEYFSPRVDKDLMRKVYYEEKEKRIKSFTFDNSRIIKETSDNSISILSTPGLVREKNEDFAAVIDRGEYKLLILCDGAGGSYEGDIASKTLVTTIVDYFKNKSMNLHECMGEVLELSRINILKNTEMGVTTLSMALVTPGNTYIYNIGDSRVYYVKNNSLVQVTNDDNHIWDLYLKGKITKDDLRFIRNQAYLTAYAKGLDRWDYKIEQNAITNYDGLFLCSDGVSSVLSDKKIESLLLEDKPIEKIITLSTLGEIETYKGEKIEKARSILAGNDNATAIYMKLKKR